MTTGGPLLISNKYTPAALNAIKQLLAWEKQLDSAKTFDAIRKIERAAEALKALLGEVDEVRQQAEWTILLAKRRVGIELEKVPKASGRPSRISATAGGIKKAGRAATGISEGTRSRLAQLICFSKSDLFNRCTALWRDGHEATLSSILHEHLHETRSARRSELERALADQIRALPDRKYGVILADPAWKFKTWSEKGKTSTSADNHYSTSDLEEIKALAIPAADDAALFLWATVPMKPAALEVMAAWGFTYKTTLYWDKGRNGTGYWSRNRIEELLIGTRGEVPISSSLRHHAVATARSRSRFTKLSSGYFRTSPSWKCSRAKRDRAGMRGARKRR